ncbi:MAG: hypothetical protein ABMA26_20000 [Limisphaerales bacterium]
MPIRINLLAEEQYLAEMRRRDPVKRGAWLGGFMVFLMLLWWGWLLFSSHNAKNALAGHEASLKRIEGKSKETGDQIKKAGDIEKNIHGLNRMATNRVLWSACMNALQDCTLPQIQVTRVRAEQNYNLVPAVLSKERGKSKPASSTERIILVITARDYGRPEDESSVTFKKRINDHPWFKQHLAKENPISFKGFSNPTADKDDSARVFVSFTMECAFTEQVRN